MATRRKKSGGSLVGMTNAIKRERAKLSAINKKKKDAAKAKKLATKLKSLKSQVANAKKRVKSK